MRDLSTEGNILAISMLLVAFSSWILSSCKTGLTYFSMQSLLGPGQRKFTVDKTKIDTFLRILAAIMVISLAFALIVTNGNTSDALLYGGFNTLAASYGLAYWILLKEKKPHKKDKK
jgi:hypothetical protein